MQTKTYESNITYENHTSIIQQHTQNIQQHTNSDTTLKNIHKHTHITQQHAKANTNTHIRTS